MTGPPDLRIAVVVATLGRPKEVAQLLEHLNGQSSPPGLIVLSVESDADLPRPLPDGVRVVMGPRGSSVQRNRGIDMVLDQCEVVAFFDDDYLPGTHSLRGMATLFQDHPDVVGATGLVLADGIRHGGIEYERAARIVADFDAAPPRPISIERDVTGTYGCNMAFRGSAIGALRFDERLPLYGWQEDVDFAARMLSQGRVVKTNAFAGVHRGVAGSRGSGVQLGFSQMVNPVYLVRKGTMSPGHAARIMAGNFIANHVRSLWPESWIDRRGRVRGNWRGVMEILWGECDPGHLLRAKTDPGPRTP